MTTQDPIPLPSEVPIMVLPGCVLFPGSMLPLRIFEPRYRAMLAWALEHERMICVAMMKPDVVEAETVDEFHHVAGIGLIRASVTQPDGTSKLLLQGFARVHLTDFIQSAPFRIARPQPFNGTPGDDASSRLLAAELRTLCDSFHASDAAAKANLLESLSEIDDPESLADFVASSFVGDPFVRQSLLEEPDGTQRLRSLSNHLRQILGQS